MTKYGIVRLDKNGNVLFSEYNRAKHENLTKAEAIRIIEDIIWNNKETSEREQAKKIFRELFGNAIKE